jgi:hypothetical protein
MRQPEPTFRGSGRKILPRRVWALPGGRDCVLTIPMREYRISAETPSGAQRLWGPHMSHSRPLHVNLYERMFYRYQNNVYIRSTTVNHDSAAGRRALVESLPALAGVPDDEPKPSKHYVSAGELHAATALQNAFLRDFDRFAALTVHHRDSDAIASPNEIVLGAARVGDPQLLWKEDHEQYQALEEGVMPDFRDNTGNPSHRTIHILLTRRAENSVKTIIQGSHGRGIQGVCQFLASDAQGVVESLRLGEKRLPDQFQIVFQVTLFYDHDSQVSSAEGPVRVVSWAAGGKRVLSVRGRRAAS